MRENKLTIVIYKPANEVFAFTINPDKTPLWLDSIEFERANPRPIGIGTIYTNKNRKTGGLKQYEVINFKENAIFELASKSGSYNVRYTYKLLNKNSTKLEYYEWDDLVELSEPFTQDVLEQLKSVIENS